MINPFFNPNEYENGLIKKIQNRFRGEFSLIRLTKTMYDKSIIDASQSIRKLFISNDIFDYYSVKIIQGEQYYLEGIIISSVVDKIKVSAYRPKTKKGDPRFWFYKLKKYADINDLIYITIINSIVVAIPLNKSFDIDIVDAYLKLHIGNTEDDTKITNELVHKLQEISNRGFIPSICISKKNDKDVGETLENALGIPVNNLVTPDFKGKIEIKSKREGIKTDDTLFCKIPDWEVSNFQSMKDIVTKYGYPDKKYPDCTSLFVTITTKPNPQGLFLDFDEENELLKLCHVDDKSITDIACWKYSNLEERLLEKHPKTAWIDAEEKKIDNKIYFKYKTLHMTQYPIFSQFISLIKQNIVVFEIRSRFYTLGDKAGKSKSDYGQPFRIKPKYRSSLFGDTKSIDL